MGSRSESICRQSQVEVRPLDQLWKWRPMSSTLQTAQRPAPQKRNGAYYKLSCELEGHALGGGMLKLELGEAARAILPLHRA